MEKDCNGECEMRDVARGMLDTFAYSKGLKAREVIRRPTGYPQDPVSTQGYERRYEPAEFGVWEIHELYDESKLPKYEDVLAEIRRSGNSGMTDSELMERFKTPFHSYFSKILDELYEAGEIIVIPTIIRRPMTQEEIELNGEFCRKNSIKPASNGDVEENILKHYAKEHAMHLTEETSASLI